MNRSFKRGALAAMAAAALALQAGTSAAAPAHDRHMAALAVRLFPLLSGLQPPASGPLAATLAARRDRVAACKAEPRCVVEASEWTPAERDVLAAAAARLAARRPAPPADDGVKAQALREVEGLNSVLKVYGLGEAPRYPEIDGPLDATASPLFAARVRDAAAIAEAARGEPVTALDPSLALAVELLDVNDRDYAIAFDPLDARENAAALARARRLDWSRYRYTAIILPGIGPDELTTPLSPTGKLNVRLAATRFLDGVAPFIIVTGGSVHPRGSHFTEGAEMRRALIERYGVPADAVVLEPYARHTTTNLRNATRRLMALHAPLDRDALIVTNPFQSRYIESGGFAARNRRELGYLPGTVGARLSPTELTFRPSPASARIDPLDPIDP